MSNAVAVRSTSKDGASLVMNGGKITGNGQQGQSWSYDSNYFAGGVSVCGSYSTSDPAAYAPAVFTMNDGTISNNFTLYEGGGVLSHSNARFIMNGGTISNNTATMGGGVAADNGFFSAYGLVASYEAKGWTAERWTEVSPGSFTMNGGTISGNYAGAYTSANPGGGGIYSLSNDVQLMGGKIIDNSSAWVGGGAYVSIYPYALNFYDAVVTGNTAYGIGGGIWLCPTGDIDIELTDAVANYNNTASYAGDDFAVYHTGDGNVLSSKITERMLGGGPSNWYLDGRVTRYDRGTGPRYSSEKTPYAHNWDGLSSIALKAVPNEASIALASSKANLIISGNSAQSGGGIGSNGHVYMGRAESKAITITKKWEIPEGSKAKLPDSITVALEITGGDGVVYTVEHVKLSAENNWTATLSDLPHHANVNIVEDDMLDGGEGWVVYYDDTGELDDTSTTSHENFTVVNARTGQLKLSKEVAGNSGDTSQEFHYTVYITDAEGQPFIDRRPSGPNSELTFSYEGSDEDYDGIMKSGDTLVLKHGQDVTISGIPHGAYYAVHEVARDALGYEVEPVRVSDGVVGEAAESGVIAGEDTVAVRYTNVKNRDMGSLSLVKKVTGDAADASNEFSFIVRFFHEDGTELLEGEFAYSGSREGLVASGDVITLAADERVTIKGIPAGTRYRVKEGAHEAEGYEIEPSRADGATGAAAEEGVVGANEDVAITYTNEKNKRMGSLAVSKTVAGAQDAHKEREFTFKVTLLHEDGTELTEGEFVYTGSREGIVASGGAIKLKHGERVTIEGLPEGTRYRVEEEAAEGYTVAATGEAGTVSAAETAEAAFVNTPAAEPPVPKPSEPTEQATNPAAKPAANPAVTATGDSMGAAVAGMIAVAILAAATLVVALVRKRRA